MWKAALSFAPQGGEFPSAISPLKSVPECCVSEVQHCRFGVQSVLFWTGTLLKSVALTAPECCEIGAADVPQSVEVPFRDIADMCCWWSTVILKLSSFLFLFFAVSVV